MKEKAKTSKAVLVIGAGSGIGRETAFAFAEAGYDLAVADINPEGVAMTADMARSTGREIWSKNADASDVRAITMLIEEAFEKFGLSLSTMIYTAGMGKFCPIVDMEPSQWDRELAVNLSGAFYCAQAVARKYIEAELEGCLLFISSIGATHNTNQVAPYCCAKAGLNMLVRCLASELGNYRIRANAVMPGVTESNMTAPMLNLSRYRNMLKSTIPLGTWAKAQDIVNLLLFLASKEARMINGQSIAVCGGHTTRPAIDWWPLDYSEKHRVDWKSPLKRYPFVKEEGEH